MEARYTKRLSASLIAALLSVLLAAGFLPGCAAPAETEDDGRMKVVTTIFPQYDFVRAIGGDLVHLRMLLSPGEEMHSYEPTPLDIKEIQNCDLFIYVGGENDVWVDRILDNMGDHRPETLRLVDLTDTVEEEIVEGMMEERGHEHDHDEVDHDEDEHRHGGDSSHEEHEEADEHVWTSPVKAAEITEAIAEKMAEIDPSNAEQYREGANAYEVQLLELDARFRELVESAERKTIVFGDRFPIRYFAEEYGLEYYAAFPGCSAETEPSASTLAFLIDKVREEEIPAVFSIELSNGNIAKAICESGGAVQRTFYSCHNLTREQMESGATYVSMMTENLEVLEEALGRKAESK
jgi:zinc transport system substrate-binding protein